MATFGGLLSVTIADLVVDDHAGELYVYDRNNQDETGSVTYYGTPAWVAKRVGGVYEAQYIKQLDADKVAYLAIIDVAVSERRRGFGRAFVAHIEGLLRSRGVELVVLLAHESEPFWRRVRYNTADYDEDGQPVMVKQL
jgi:GNAT superfamily N-acetyltransferase